MAKYLLLIAFAGLAVGFAGCSGGDQEDQVPDEVVEAVIEDDSLASETWTQEQEEIDEEVEESWSFFNEPEAMKLEDTYIRQKKDLDKQLESLSEYSRNAETNDPFALSEERVDELSKIEGLQFQ